jgi:ABC-2 type transport system permease protein
MSMAMLRMQVLVEQRIFWRNRSTTFFTFFLPLALLASLAVSDDPSDRVPLIVALGILSTGFQGLAIQLAMHRDQGVLKRVIASPLPASVLVAGKVLSTMFVALLELAIIVFAGVVIFGAPVPEHPAYLVLFSIIGTAAFVALAFAVASVTPTADSAPAVVNAAYLGLILVTALAHQVDGLPDVLREIGEAFPLTHLFVPIEHAWLGGWETNDWWSAVVLLAWGLAATAWTVRHFRWVPVEER